MLGTNHSTNVSRTAMTLPQRQRNALPTLTRWVVFFSLALCFYFFRSCLSPINSFTGNFDVNCFYMLGKAVCHGYVPYADVTDVKGPCLFLFYALGYALGHTTGVMLLFVICLTLTLEALYRIARIYLQHEGWSLLATIFPLLMLCNPAYTSGSTALGGRAEGIILPLLAWGLYAALRYLRTARRCDLYRAAAVLGSTGACIFLIKFNNVLPPAVAALLLLMVAIRRQESIATGCRYVLLGLLCFVLPILGMGVVLAAWGALERCIDTYFITNLFALRPIEGKSLLATRVISLVFRSPASSLCTLCALLLPACASKLCSKLPPADILLFLLWGVASVLASYYLHFYYFIVTVPMGIVPGIVVCHALQRHYFLRLPMAYACLFALFLTAMSYGRDIENGLIRLGKHQQPKQAYQQLEQRVSQVQNAKLIYLNFLDAGLGLSSESLPACTHWMHTNGTEHIGVAEREDCIRKRIPDFIITIPHKNAIPLEYGSHPDMSQGTWLQQCGYVNSIPDDEGLSLWERAESTAAQTP